MPYLPSLSVHCSLGLTLMILRGHVGSSPSLGIIFSSLWSPPSPLRRASVPRVGGSRLSPAPGLRPPGRGEGGSPLSHGLALGRARSAPPRRLGGARLAPQRRLGGTLSALRRSGGTRSAPPRSGGARLASGGARPAPPGAVASVARRPQACLWPRGHSSLWPTLPKWVPHYSCTSGRRVEARFSLRYFLTNLSSSGGSRHQGAVPRPMGS